VFRFLQPILVIVPALLLGCSSQPSAPATGPQSQESSASAPADAWTPIAESALSAAQQQQKTRALAARDQLFDRLMARLAAVIQTAGPAGAVAVCREEAPNISRAVSAEMGVSIGRTSHKLRNPNNRPRPWVA
jgi:hypothetical protein